jgi:Uma2 family endonuclease
MLLSMHATDAGLPKPQQAPSSQRRTIEQWLAIPPELRAELIDGELIYQGLPGPAHGTAQSGIIAFLRGPYHRRAGSGNGPGGWWISMEVDLEIGGSGCRPDVLGWRREKHPSMPEPDKRGVVTAPPDWICEVLSPSTAHIDLGAKRRAFHHAGVSHYWLVDPHHHTLAVLRWSEEDYLVVLAAGRRDKVRAPPFEGVEIDVGEVFGDDEDLESSP